MFERFTESARQTVALAQKEARNFKHNYIGTEHLLLSLLCKEESLAAKVLNNYMKVDDVRKAVTRIVGVGEEEVSTQQIPFTPRVKKVYELALRESLALGHNYIGTEHILLGLVRENEGVASRILFDHYITPDTIRNDVMRMLSGASGASRRAQKEQLREERVRREQKARERDKEWEPHKKEGESLSEDGRHELAVKSVRGQVITICGDLTLEVDRDIYGRLNILIKNPSGLPVQISEK